jgi:hypothetical protein
MPKYNHMLDVAFTIESEHKNWEDIAANDLIAALERRVAYLKAIIRMPTKVGEAFEAFGICDSYEVEISHMADGSSKRI